MSEDSFPESPLECEGLESKVTGIRPNRAFWKNFAVEGNCWVWKRYLNPKGYGRVKAFVPDERTVITHRLAYQILVGEIPDGKVLDHTCYNKACANPRHLRLLTDSENRQNQSSGHGISKVRGVKLCGGTWSVGLVVRGKYHYGGTFPYLQLAEATQASIDLRNKFFTYNDADKELQRMVDSIL